MLGTTRSLFRHIALPIGVMLTLIGMLLLGVGTVSADPPGNNGTVKIHEGATEDEPIVANEPHVCTFHLHFFYGDEVQAGSWWIVEWPPTADDERGEPVLSGTYDATSGEARVPAEGVFQLPDGHYKLFWEGATNPGGQTPVKHKVFWVACEVIPTATPVASEPEITATPVASESEVIATPVASEPEITATPAASESEVIATATPVQSEGVLPGNPTPAPSGGELPSTSLPVPGIDLTLVGTLLMFAGSSLGLAGAIECRR